MLTLRPTGGLCNRMLAIDSAIKLCRDIEQDLTIHWVQNHYLNAAFTDLFKPIQVEKPAISFEVTDQKWLLHSDRELAKNKQLIYNRLLKIYQRTHFNKVIQSLEVEGLLKSGFDFTRLANYNKTLISSFHRFYSNRIAPEFFQPTAALQAEIDRICAHFSAHTIGIHIRRGDHRRSIKLSPTSLFIEKMEADIAQNSETTFYLASDSDEEKRTLGQRFGDRLLMQDDQLGDRNSIEGMKRAVIDLYCLSNTNRILGSFYSTFSVVAAELKGIGFEEVKLTEA